MKRTIVTYGGTQYTIPDEDAVQVRERITDGLRSAPFMWLQVNHGDGRVTPAVLLVSTATPVAIITERGPEEQTSGTDAVRYALGSDEELPASPEGG